MKKVLIVGNGERNKNDFYKKISQGVDFIIGVDQGAKTLIEAGIKPGLAIGDFDSLKDLDFLERAGVKILKFPTEKNESDTELAINYAKEKEFDYFIFSGMLGGRVDHLLFNISLLYRLLKEGKHGEILEEREEIYITQDGIEIYVRVGDIISILPITGIAYGVKTEGLKYELHRSTLRMGSTLPLSNVSLSQRVSVSLKKGIVLVIVEKLNF